MRTTAWLLPVGLVLAVIGGCSSSRFSLAKADPPAKKPKDADQVVYGNPWKRSKKEDPKPSAEMTAEMAKVRKDMDAAKAANNDLTPWLKNAAEAEGKGDLAAAKGLYQKILDKDPNNGEAHHRLAVIADQQQDARKADEHYLKALTVNRRDADLLSDMGYSLYLRGKFDESESRLKEALEANPYHRGAQSNLGLVYGRQGKYDQALASFRQSGTESEAQKNIAQLFPNGRPNAAAGQGNGTAVADNNRRGAPALPVDVDQRMSDASFPDVVKSMQQAREAAERARAQQPPGQMGTNPNAGQPLMSAAPSINNAVGMNNPAGSNNAFPNPQNGVPTNWPPVAATAPPTFKPLGGSNGAPSAQPGASPTGNWANPAPNSMTTAIPMNAAKPQDADPFWRGNLDKISAPTSNPAAPPSNAFAANMSPPPNYGAGMNPPPDNMWGAPTPPTAMGNSFPPQNFNTLGNGISPAGYVDPSNPNVSRSNSSMNDSQRIAAQMAMQTGPGGLLPVVNAGPTAAPLPPTNPGNGVGWAYGEMSGNANRHVENAMWSSPEGMNRGVPANNASQTNPAPGQPWADWASPAPATINWQDDASGNPASAIPNWNPNGANTAPPTNGAGSMHPQWNGGGNNNNGAMMTNPNANVDTYRWDGTPVNAPADNRARNDAGTNSTTIPNWPYAPTRP